MTTATTPPVVVLDNSFAVTCVVPEAHTAAAQARLFTWDQTGVSRIAPLLLSVEAASVCRKHRVGRRLPDETIAMQVFTTIIATVTSVADDHVLAGRALEISGLIGATRAYDALYVALAERTGCELWTGDSRLWHAAKAQFPFVRFVGEPL